MMKRTALNYIQNWLTTQDRKPLIIRGARQVGKTWLARYFASVHQKKLIEVNLEKQPALADLFNSNNPAHILLNLSAEYGDTFDPKTCLLFIDEIQAVPELLAKLRWFAEDFPELPVIAAGSLLDFALAEHVFSMPVGRISYLYLEPMSFEEFLLAHDKEMLCNYLAEYRIEQPLPASLHEQLLQLFKEYIIVGGLPAVVSSWVSERSLSKINQLQHDLLATYRDDFAKYSKRITVNVIDGVMMSIPKTLGYKFVYSRVNASVQAGTIKLALDLLHKARVCHPVLSSSANGIPLRAEVKEKYFKEIFLDVGLCCAALGLSFKQIQSLEEIVLINQGGIAEQVAGQLLRTIFPPYIEPALYYWQREQKGAQAEVDYIMQHHSSIIPIEIKAGSTGSLKSLHVLMGLKNLLLALRINSAPPSPTIVNVTNQLGQAVSYTLLSIPFYLIGQVHRLLELV